MEADVTTDIQPRARLKWSADDLITDEILVDGRAARYASGGRGLPVFSCMKRTGESDQQHDLSYSSLDE